MWYKTENLEVYWLTTSVNEAIDPASPPSPEHLAYRNILPTDHLYDFGYTGKFKFKIMVMAKPLTKLESINLKDYPPHPDYLSLKVFLNKHIRDGSSNILRFDKDLQLSMDNTAVSLVFCGGYILNWTVDGVTGFYIVDPTVEPYKTYGDKRFEYRSSDGYWQIKSPNCDWIPLAHGLKFRADLSPINEQDAFTQLGMYKRSTKLIDDYLMNISPETISRMVGDAPKGSVVASRCEGCHAGHPSHYKVHLQRNELPFFLVYWVMSDLHKHALFATWDLIEACRVKDEVILEEFKDNLRIFLMMSVVTTEILLDLPKLPPSHVTPKLQKLWKPKSLNLGGTLLHGGPPTVTHEAPMTWLDVQMPSFAVGATFTAVPQDGEAVPPMETWPEVQPVPLEVEDEVDFE